MQTLTDALARSLPLECDMPVRRLEPRADGSWTVTAGTTIQAVARAVVLALPAYGAASLVGEFAPRAAEGLSAIPYAPVGIVVTAYRRDDVAHPLDGFGYLAPAVEKPALLGTLFSSTMFAQRAQPGTVVFTSFLGGRRHPEHVGATDGELLELARGELQRLVGARGAPVLSDITRWPQAIPQYAFGHRARIAVLEQTERGRPGLYFRANYRGGVSVSDCISRGNELARAVELQLAAARTVGGQRGNA
jgi:oxygen-dependent protoporphyrinogen oxidase